MSQVIRISDELFKRLESYASGFDTPAKVIEKILDGYEAFGGEGINEQNSFTSAKERKQIKRSDNLELIYEQGCEEEFKKAFLKQGKAYIKLYYTNSLVQTKEWKLNGFNSESSVDGNLRSGRLRGWREKGISKAIIGTSQDLYLVDH